MLKERRITGNGSRMCGWGWGTEGEAEGQTRNVRLSRQDTVNIRRERVKSDQSREMREGGGSDSGLGSGHEKKRPQCGGGAE